MMALENGKFSWCDDKGIHYTDEGILLFNGQWWTVNEHDGLWVKMLDELDRYGKRLNP
jgi:hypothetical protein